MMWQLLFAVLWLIPTVSFGATIYIDGTLPANCITGNYSIINRTCAGQDGNAYNNIQSALNASGTEDTINIRAGTYVSNAAGAGIEPKAGQIWQAYDNETVTINAGSHKHVFMIFGLESDRTEPQAHRRHRSERAGSAVARSCLAKSRHFGVEHIRCEF